ncbi:uncharacterized protein PV09_09467 [Verruconis gallopava]|uniref:Uncharacterized protein n=1 Tax=Verruconis gallopava TaxID=253628 RepID=A0A0D1ZXG9_9PEZI|nr:uncharacterized protein PV09_09467 [Verruconis gallopava]KIV98769.1 hypothetical protein PV09_09467 [Verruconis gallopava]
MADHLDKALSEQVMRINQANNQSKTMALIASKVSQLSTPQDWIQWFSMVKTTAMDQDVWSYCDPDKSNELVQPGDPSQLTATQERLYTLKINDYERKRKGLAKVNATIQGTVCEDYQTYL